MNQQNKKITSPILSRLTSQGNSRPSSDMLLQSLRESVRYDLECLLNTRYRCVSANEKYTHLQSSLLNYGLPDLSTVNLSSHVGRHKFCRQIEQTITKYDPRIRRVKVTTESNIDTDDPTIRFRVEAKLFANPAPETIVFDSSLNPVTQLVAVNEVF
jgi:type VI secretion system protein ImpF